MAKKAATVKKAMTKSEILSEIAGDLNIARKQVAAVFESLEDIIRRHVKTATVAMFTLPGLLKIKTVKRPARKAQKGVPNPFKPGELMDIAARPASTRIKVLPLKKLKDMVR